MKTLFLVILLTLSIQGFSQVENESAVDKFSIYTNVLMSLIKGSLDSKGLTMESLLKPNVASWEEILSKIDTKISQKKCQNFECPEYIQEFASIVSSNATKAKAYEILGNERAFELRTQLIRQAKRSIWIMVWGFYDDLTGKSLENEILEATKQNPLLDVKILVDGTMSNLKGRRLLKRLERQSSGMIKVMRWNSRKYSANGSHRKLFIVDGEHVICGGMNIGDAYSHKIDKFRWRDLDIYLEGISSGNEAQALFTDVWNSQLLEYPKLINKLGKIPLSKAPVLDGDIPVVFIDQSPGSAVRDSTHHIHTAIVKLLRSSQESIDIENAYVILDPIIRGEIKKCLQRGVVVRIFTNSDKSVDEKIVSSPILKSARDLVRMGALVYLKEGPTLHSKFLVVDRKVSLIGSFNFHPRSLRFDAESVVAIFQPEIAMALTHVFESGIKEATQLTDPEKLKIEWDIFSLIAEKIYFDFL